MGDQQPQHSGKQQEKEEEYQQPQQQEQEQFIRVTRGRKRRSDNTQVNPLVRPDGTIADIHRTLDQLGTNSEIANMVNWCTVRIDRILNGEPVSRIIVLGNGHFDSTRESGAHQLAFVLQLQKKYATGILFQEPALSFAEKEWISEQEDIILRKESDLLIDPTRGFEIVVFIHTIHPFINDFMWHRWNVMSKSIFIINDYATIDIIGGRRAVNDELEALNVFRSTATSYRLPNYPPNEIHFSDTSIMHAEQETLPEISEERPTYREQDSG